MKLERLDIGLSIIIAILYMHRFLSQYNKDKSFYIVLPAQDLYEL